MTGHHYKKAIDVYFVKSEKVWNICSESILLSTLQKVKKEKEEEYYEKVDDGSTVKSPFVLPVVNG